jgi:hypothetical protein
MAAAPEWKIYNPRGLYMAATKEPAAALVLAEFYGHGSTVRLGHDLVAWTENGTTPWDNYEEAEQILRENARRALRRR